MEVEAADLVVVVAGVVESASGEVVAVGVDGDLVFIIAEVGAAALLIDGVEDMEELADVAKFVVG